MTDPLATLRACADDLGIVDSYEDVFGHRHALADDTLVAVAASLLGVEAASAAEVAEAAVAELADRRRRLERGGPPVRVFWLEDPDGTVTVEMAGPGRGGAERLELGLGRHVFGSGGPDGTRTILVAPRRLPALAPGARQWGLFAPVWSVWERDDHVVGLGALERISRWIARHDGTVVGTLPLLATYLDRPCDPSPYTPASRRWWNENYLDTAALGEPVRFEPADPRRFDAPGQWAQRRAALRGLADRAFSSGSSEADELAAWVAANPEVVTYGRFRATVDSRGAGWRRWRSRDLQVGADDPAARTYMYAQWQLQRQLGALAEGLSGRDQLLYLDLALGSHGDGFDTWAEPASFAWGLTVGAPPDALFEGGQNWGFPPVHPETSRLDGHAYFAACLRAHMEVCGMLRIDHVMGLFRLFVVPESMDPTRGAYVRYPAEELLAVLAIEAHRSGTVVVGENLGTVPPEVAEAIERHGLYGMHVHQLAPDATATTHDLASVNTHDTPTYAAWAEGRSGAGEFGPTVLSLAAGDAPVVMVSIDDLLGETEPQNVPGTDVDRPNWVLRAARPFGELATDPAVDDLLGSVAQARRRKSRRVAH